MLTLLFLIIAPGITNGQGADLVGEVPGLRMTDATGSNSATAAAENAINSGVAATTTRYERDRQYLKPWPNVVMPKESALRATSSATQQYPVRQDTDRSTRYENVNRVIDTLGMEARQYLEHQPTAAEQSGWSLTTDPVVSEKGDQHGATAPIGVTGIHSGASGSAQSQSGSHVLQTEQPRINDADLYRMSSKQIENLLESLRTEPAPTRLTDTRKLAEPAMGVATEVFQDPRSDPARARNIDMFAGEVRVLDRVAVKRVAVGNGNIIRVEVLDNGDLLVIGEAAGSSSLHLWHGTGQQSSFNVRVSATDPQTRLPQQAMVRMRVKMIEFRKSALEKLGIEWDRSAAGPTAAIAGDPIGNHLFRPASDALTTELPTSVKPFASYFGLASSIGSRIHFLLNTGDAVLLAEPVLSCINGGEATFLAGGEVPYPLVSATGQQTVEFKEYGIKLEVAPLVDASGKIQTSVLTEISTIDPAVSVQGAPGLLTRRSRTQVTVMAGETIVIAGLLQSDRSDDDNSVPGLGRLPVIGKLFRSRQSRHAVSELVIFITPEVIDTRRPQLAGTDQRIHRYSQQVLGQSRDQLRYQIMD